MCEKNFEGKIMSPPSKDPDDINEETILDDDVEEIVKKTKKKKRSSRRKKSPLYKYCKTCGEDILENERRDMFMFQDTYHQLQAKDYCEDHERLHSEHTCKPSWCGDCGYLTKYEITIDWKKKNKKW
tara:strand:+ start:71 stop:451 length:381 start_codon:yes stop_codon:yes gene_type:complete